MITSLDRTHAGFYRCIVRNRMGALLQRQTEVQVACEYRATRGRGACSGGGPSRTSHPPSMLIGAPGGRAAPTASSLILQPMARRPGAVAAAGEATRLINDTRVCWL